MRNATHSVRAALLAALSLLLVSPALAQNNLILYGDFEGFATGEVEPATIFTGYNQGAEFATYSIVDTEAVSGSQSLSVQYNGGAENFYLVQNFQPVAVTGGQEYTFSFQAKTGAADGSASIAYAVNQDQFGENLGVVYEAEVTTEWQTYEITFTAPEAAAQVSGILQFGYANNEDGPIYIDDLSLTAVGGGSMELVTNGGFESSDVGAITDLMEGVEGWLFETNAAVTTAPDYAIVDTPTHDGDRALAVTVNEATSQSWHIQAVAEDIAVTPGETYVYTVWARAEADGATASFTVGDYNYSEYGRLGSQTLTTEWQQFTLPFTINNDSTLARAPIHFSFAGNVGNTIYIDDLSIQPEPEMAMLQIIHNAPDPAAATVDIYVNGELFVDDLDFREATAFVEVPAGVELAVDVVPGDAEDNTSPVYTAALTLEAEMAYQVIAAGVLDDTPDDDTDDVDDEFQLVVAMDAQTEAAESSTVDVRVVHGTPDAPAVAVLTGGAVLVADLAYPNLTDYVTVAPDTYVLAVAAADNSATVGWFNADLSGAAGSAVTILASGFLDPAGNGEGAPEFGLLAVMADGEAMLLSRATAAEDDPAAGLALAVANPVQGRATVTFTVGTPGPAEVALFDVLGRRVTVLASGEVPAGAQTVPLEAGRLAAGVYVLRLETETGAVSRTVTVVR